MAHPDLGLVPAGNHMGLRDRCLHRILLGCDFLAKGASWPPAGWQQAPCAQACCQQLLHCLGAAAIRLRPCPLLLWWTVAAGVGLCHATREACNCICAVLCLRRWPTGSVDYRWCAAQDWPSIATLAACSQARGAPSPTELLYCTLGTCLALQATCCGEAGKEAKR